VDQKRDKGKRTVEVHRPSWIGIVNAIRLKKNWVGFWIISKVTIVLKHNIAAIAFSDNDLIFHVEWHQNRRQKEKAGITKVSTM
jgi:hypothetical protein